MTSIAVESLRRQRARACPRTLGWTTWRYALCWRVSEQRLPPIAAIRNSQDYLRLIVQNASRPSVHGNGADGRCADTSGDSI